jgi:hypothetical protein
MFLIIKFLVEVMIIRIFFIRHAYASFLAFSLRNFIYELGFWNFETFVLLQSFTLYPIIICNLRSTHSGTRINRIILIDANNLIALVCNTLFVTIAFISHQDCWFNSGSNTFWKYHHREANNKIDSVSENPHYIEGSFQFNEAKNFIWPWLL